MPVSGKRKISKPTPVEAEIHFTDYYHSGHLYYFVKRAQAGFVPARIQIMQYYCETVARGDQPKPVIHAYVAGVLKRILDGNSANKAFGTVRDRAGRTPKRLQGDFLRIIVSDEDRVKLMKLMPGYRDWEICRQMEDQLKQGHPLKAARSTVASSVGVSESTVGRAWNNCKQPDTILNEYFLAAERAKNRFTEFMNKYMSRNNPDDIASRWVRESIGCFTKLGRETAARWPDETAKSSWYKLAAFDEDFAGILMYRIGRHDFGGHLAGISESDACDAFTRSFEKASPRSARKARPA